MAKKLKKKGVPLKTIEKKVKEVYRDSVHLMREGIYGLEVMAEKAMEVAKIRLANQKAVKQMRELFLDIGRRVYDSVMKKAGRISLSPDLKPLLNRVRQLQIYIEDNLNRLKHVTSVGGGGSMAKMKKAAKKKKL